MAQIVVSKLNVGDPITKEFLDALCDGVNGAGNVIKKSVPEILNGGFQYDVDGDGEPDNWHFVETGGGTRTLEDLGGPLGNKFVRITHPGGASPAGGGYIENADGAIINISENKNIWVSWAYRCSQATNLHTIVAIEWYAAAVDPTTLSETIIYDTDGWTDDDGVVHAASNNPTDWRYFAFYGKPPATARWAKIRLYGGVPGVDPGAPATTDFADVRIFEPATTGYVWASETPATYEIVVPSNCVWMKGAAVGSGGGASGGPLSCGAGGAAKIEGWFRVHPGRTLTVVIPTGGTGGVGTAFVRVDGTDGAAATITDEDGTVLVSATGGAKGTNAPGAGGTVAFTEDLPNRRHGANGSNAAAYPSQLGGNPGQFILRDFFNNGTGGTTSALNGIRGGGGAVNLGGKGGNGGPGFVEVWL